MHRQFTPKAPQAWLAASLLMVSTTSLALPPTDTFENRMIRAGSSEPKRIFEGIALEEVPDSPEVLELSARLHQMLASVRALPDTESTQTHTQWLPHKVILKSKEASPSFPKDRLNLARNKDPHSTGLERVHQGRNRESVARMSGVFESHHIDDTNSVDTRWGMVRQNELIVGQRHVEGFQVGGVERPMMTALERRERQIPRMNYEFFAAGPTITMETFLLQAIGEVHADNHAGFNLAGSSIERTSPEPHITRYIQTIRLVNTPGFQQLEFDFDSRFGGSLVRTYRGWLGETPAGDLPRSERIITASYAAIPLGESQVWLPVNFHVEQRQAKHKEDTELPLARIQSTTKRFESTRFLSAPHPDSVFNPEWSRPDAPLVPRVAFQGQVIEDPAVAAGLVEAYGS